MPQYKIVKRATGFLPVNLDLKPATAICTTSTAIHPLATAKHREERLQELGMPFVFTFKLIERLISSWYKCPDDPSFFIVFLRTVNLYK